MRRTATAVLLLATFATYLACSADAPTATPSPTPGPGPNGTSALQIQLFTTNPNPSAGACTLIQAIVKLNGVNVPDGTGVAFSTDFGIFSQNGLPLISVTTQNGAAVTALCSNLSGLANVHASARVGNESGSASISISFQPSAQAAPFFTFCNPSNGPSSGGTTLTINGGRFTGSVGTTRVTFTAAGVTREALVTDLTATTLTVTTPGFPEAVAPTVPTTIMVTFNTNSSTPTILTIPNCFVFGTQASGTPSVTAVLPASGSNSGNTRVTIVGSGFVAPLQVFFGPVEAQVLSVTFNQIVALTPPASGAGLPNLNQTVTVRVHEVNSGVDGSLVNAFRFTPAIQITSNNNSLQRVDQNFSPVTIFGQGFQAPVAVSLAGVVVNSILSVSATEIVVIPGFPASITGCKDIAGAVSVTNIDSGDTASGSSFTYLVAVTAPVISSINPPSGPPGTAVTIIGNGMSLVNTVKFGSRAASITAQSATSITVVAPDPGGAPPACPSGTPPGTLVNGTLADITLTATSTGCAVSATGAFLYQQPCSGSPLTPDLAVTKSANPSTVTSGSNTTFSIVVNNIGTADATGVVITDPLPANTTFSSCTVTAGTCSFAAGTVTANVGTIPPGGFANFSIVVNVTGPPRQFTNNASATTTAAEPNLGNNTGSATVTVQ